MTAIYSITAANEFADKHDFVKDYLRFNQYNIVMKSSSVNSFDKETNKIGYIFSIVRQVRYFTYSLVSDIDLDGVTLSSDKAEYFNKIIQRIKISD